MYNLLLQLTFMISLGIIVYLVAVAVPRIEEDKHSLKRKARKRIYFSFEKGLEKADLFFKSSKTKLLRRLKVIILKFDNFVSRQLNKDKDKI